MNFQKPRGTTDYYYESLKELRALEIILRDLVDKYNFSEIKTPMFEEQQLFTHSVGNETDIVNKEMFELVSRNEKKYVLKPEGTASILRAVLENKLHGKYELPLKLFYFDEMFRYERPQHGRLREFYQFGVEVLGTNSYLLDIEVILLAYTIFKSLNVKGFTLHLNCLADKENKQKYVADLKNYLSDKELCDDCKTRINVNPLRVLDCKIDNKLFDNAPKIYEYLSEEQHQYFSKIQSMLKKLDIKFILDHKLVRGLDYYTSLVFEINITSNNKELTLLGGGRYNNLAQVLEPSTNLPSIGFALGIERLLLVLQEQEIKLTSQNYIDIYIVCLSDNARYFSSSLLLMLRSAGYKCDCDYLDRGVKAQFKSTERLNAKHVIIIGDQELKQNIVKIKTLNNKKEKDVRFEKILNYLEKESK